MQAWMHPREKQLITNKLNCDTVMLEWGSGGSTLEFSPLVNQYYSIEHNKEWFNSVKSSLEHNNIKNVNYNFVAQNNLNPDRRQSEYYHFKDYLNIIDSFNTKFDVVLIDGRARRLCAKKVIPYLKEDSIVIIHDWVLRREYHCVTDYYNILEYIDDTPQTIASFKLRATPKPEAYTLELNGWDRVGPEENFFKKT